MTDIPSISDIENSLILAERVELLVASIATGNNANDRLVTMNALELDIISPETRFNHGTRRTYGHGSPDISLRFTLYVTNSIIDYLRVRSLRNSSNNIIPIFKWAMKVTAINGTSKMITVNGKLTERRYVKENAEQGSPVTVQCVVRIIDESDPVAL